MRSNAVKVGLGLLVVSSLLALLVVERTPQPVSLLEKSAPEKSDNFFTEFAHESDQYARAILGMEDSLSEVGKGIVAGSLHNKKPAVQAHRAQSLKLKSAKQLQARPDQKVLPEPSAQAERAAAKVLADAKAAGFKVPGDKAKAETQEAEAGEAKKRYSASKANDELSNYFDTIPVFKVNAYHEAGAGEKHELHKYGAQKAEGELDRYFKGLPVKHVKANHEGTAARKYHGMKGPDAETDLESWFNKRIPARNTHRSTLAAKKAATDLAAYYDSIPTEHVNAFHEASHPILSKHELASRPPVYTAKQAVNDLKTYYDSIPLQKHQNAFHEEGAPEHAEPKLARYNAKQAENDLENFFSSVPTHHVNAMHESDRELATERPVHHRAKELAARRPVRHSAQAPSARVQMQTQISKEEAPQHRVSKAAARSSGTELNDEFSTSEKKAADKMRKDEAKFEKELNEEMRLGLGMDVDDKKPAARLGKGISEKQVVKEAEEVIDQGLVKKVMGTHPDEANLSDDLGPDADEPFVSVTDRKRVGYDTQYGLKTGLAKNVPTEQTPGGTVETDLMSQKARASQLGISLAQYQQKLVHDKAVKTAELKKEEEVRKAKKEQREKRIQWIRNEPLREARLQRMEKEKELDEREEALMKWEEKHKDNLEKELAEHHEHLVLAKVVEPDGFHPVVKEKVVAPKSKKAKKVMKALKTKSA